MDNTYRAIVMAELAQVREEFPRHCASTSPTAARPGQFPAASMARPIDTKLDRNEIWD